MKFDYAALRFWLQVAQVLFTLVIGIYVWWTNREKVTADKFTMLEAQVSERITEEDLDEVKSEYRSRFDDLEAEHKDRLDRHRREMVEMANKLIKLESDICHLPNQMDMKALGDRIGRLQESLGEFSGRLSGINRAVDLINEFLIQKGLTGP